MSEVWTVNWAHGRFDLRAKGGMLAGVVLKVGGHEVTPFYEAPWIATGAKAEPAILENLRCEFPCVPFGADYPQESVVDDWTPSLRRTDADREIDETDFLLHGFGSVAQWQLVDRDDHSVEIVVDYPESSAIRRLVRKVAADQNGPNLDFSLTIETRRAVSRPIGIHPNFALPELAGTFHIKPGTFEFGIVHAAGPEPDVSRAKPGATFEDITKIPQISGGTAPFDRLPFAHDTEELLQLCGIDGHVELHDEASRVVYTLDWNPKDFSSLLLWMSNRGRSYAPWDSRNLCVGVEPMTGAFDLGTRAGLASNPINRRGVATTVALDPHRPRLIEYRFTAASSF